MSARSKVKGISNPLVLVYIICRPNLNIVHVALVVCKQWNWMPEWSMDEWKDGKSDSLFRMLFSSRPNKKIKTYPIISLTNVSFLFSPSYHHYGISTFLGSSYTCMSYCKVRRIWTDRYGQTVQTQNFEPPHEKTNKMTVRPAKTQISLDIHPVWPASPLSAWRKLWSLAIH